MGISLAHTLSETGHSVRAFDLPTVDFSALKTLSHVEILQGDITQRDSLLAAVEGMDAVVHLAAILPPASESRRELTLRVNVEGTRNLVWAMETITPNAHLIFSSSVSTYGDTTANEPPITSTHPQNALDTYAESKILAEEAVRSSSLSHTILRISGVAVPGFLEPPHPWPFMPMQRMEFVARDDVVRALAACVGNDKARDKVLHIAGGESWRMLGYQYVARFNELIGLDTEDAKYKDSAGYYDWYDTGESQALLGYQTTSFEGFLQLTREAIEEFLGLNDIEDENW
ncbi:MAG: hypothetical protein A2Y73_05430 [Chloroflexi bacterium RBG_13_56_8]|nr:MAG: hypothetical protein A2Y73_05430 [Chloroflexi bacterium RBG_13_56_8]